MGFFKGKKIVVTGGGGFIGSHLIEKLLELESNVIVIDPMFYGNKIEHLKSNKNLHIYNVDIREYEKMNKLVREASIIYHLASIVGVENSYKNPVKLLDIDIHGTENVLKSAVKNDVKKIIFASSSEVYGDVGGKAIEKGPFSCKTTYGYAKLLGEEYCRAYSQEFGLNYVCLRYFNVYGPRQDERFVIPTFVKRCFQNLPPKIYGNGNQTRDFTYVDDTIKMTLLATEISGANNQILNIGTGRNVKIIDLAKLILKFCNKLNNLQPVFIPYSKKRPKYIEIYNRVADISKVIGILNYAPKISLEKGLKKYVNWYVKKNGL